MQYQFTMELRVDFADKEKLETMKDTWRSMARQALATADLLKDKVKPSIALFSDDFYEGQAAIELYADLTRDGAKQLEAAGDQTTGEVSQELLDALK